MKKYYALTGILLLLLFYSTAQTPSLQWVQSVGSPNPDAGNDLQIDGSNNLSVGLGLNGPADIDPGPGSTIVAAGYYDVKYDANGNFKSYLKDTVLVENYIYKNGFTYFIGYFDNTYDFDPGAGIKKINSPYTDFCVAKYSQNNTLLWVDDFQGSDENTQLEGGIAIDNNGNCYVTGYIYGNTVDMDPSSNTKLLQGDANAQHNYIAAAYDANGNYKWAFKLNVNNSNNEFPVIACVSNKVFLTGDIDDSVDLDPGASTHTVKSDAQTSFVGAYDNSNGNYLWGFAYQSESTVAVTGMHIDSLGSVVVNGFHSGDVDVDPGSGVSNLSGNGRFLAKYTAGGNYSWGIPIAPAGYTSFHPSTMAIDPQNNILLGGADYSADSFNIAVIKYETNGAEDWNFKLTNYGGNDFCDGIVTDHSGNIYITGAFTNTIDFDPGNGINSKTSVGAQDVFFAKYKDNSVLPVTLINFSGETDNKQNLLHWTTATEENNTGFEMQRSSDGTSFSKIGFTGTKALNGNSTLQLIYDYKDGAFTTATNYYRLKQIDKDGKFSYSNVVVLKDNNIAVSNLLVIYPNPANNILNVKITSPINNQITFLIADVSGKILQTKIRNTGNGETIEQFNISNLPGGIYILKVLSPADKMITQKKFVKQ